MNILSFNSDSSSNAFSNNDALSGFKQQPEKAVTIRQGMSAKEISDIVSDKIIAIVNEQFQATKMKFQGKEKNNL